MGYISKTVKNIMGIKTAEINDAVKYNSKDNINQLHKSFTYFKSTLTNSIGHVKEVYKLIIEKNVLLEQQSILDVGCGPGILLNYINKDYSNCKLKGLDFSETKIENCKKVYPDITFETHSIYEDYNESFDIVICTEVLEHLEYPHKALNKLLPLINQNGQLLITVPNGRLDTFGGHIYFWGPESWILFLNENINSEFTIETGLFNNSRNNYALIKRVNK